MRQKRTVIFLLIPLPYDTSFAIETPTAHDALISSPPPHINWSGKRMLWLGTSIPHQGVGVDGYPEQFCQRMGCTVTNNAFSGSHIRWFEKDVDGMKANRNGLLASMALSVVFAIATLVTGGASMLAITAFFSALGLGSASIGGVLHTINEFTYEATDALLAWREM